MSDVIDAAVKALSEKLSGSFDGVARFDIAGEGALIVDSAGVRAGGGDDAADVTLRADAETFEAMMNGELDPTSAFMTGRLTIDGDMGMAMKLSAILT